MAIIVIDNFLYWYTPNYLDNQKQLNYFQWYTYVFLFNYQQTPDFVI